MSNHLDFWLSVNLCARGGDYDTFTEVAIISGSHLITPLQKSMHDKSYAKTRVHRSFTLLLW